MKTPKAKPPSNQAKWKAFSAIHTPFYVGGFAKGSPVGRGVSFTNVVRASMKTLAFGPWETTTIIQGQNRLVIGGFADKGDFDRVMAHHGGRAWVPPLAGAALGFYATHP